MGEDVIARSKCLEQSHCRGCPTPKRSSPCAAFERADSFLERLTIWIVVARVHEPARVGALYVTLESRGKMNRNRNCAGGGIDCVPGVHGQSFNAHRIADLSTRHGLDSSHFLFERREWFRFDASTGQAQIATAFT